MNEGVWHAGRSIILPLIKHDKERLVGIRPFENRRRNAGSGGHKEFGKISERKILLETF